MISKSDYISFVKQPAWLWIKKNLSERIPPLDTASRVTLQTSMAFKSRVESLFPDGILIEWDYRNRDWQAIVSQTKSALQTGETTLLRAGFIWDEFVCISDIVRVVGDREVNLYEIKSNSKTKAEHIHELAFQKVILENNGYKVNRLQVIHVNKKYFKHGPIDNSKLAAFDDVTNDVADIIKQTAINMQKAKTIPELEEMPDPNPKHTKLGSRQEWRELYAKVFPLGQVEVEYPGIISPSLNKPELSKFLSGLCYPLYFLDYESMQALVPYFDGQRPYQQIPFQFSLHILKQPGADYEHLQYLHLDKSNPTEIVARELVKDIGETGSIIAWNMGFEKSINTSLGVMHPEYKQVMQNINSRMVDLITPFKARWYDDLRFEGSTSLKKILPIMSPDLSYDIFDIKDGNTAQRTWMEVILDGKRSDERDKIVNNLLEYCKMDTWAMVRILQVLEGVVNQ